MQYQAITAPGGPKPKHAMVLELLCRRHDAARTRIEELNRRGDDPWEDLKPVLERQWETLGNDFDHSLRWFRQGYQPQRRIPMKRDPAEARSFREPRKSLSISKAFWRSP